MKIARLENIYFSYPNTAKPLFENFSVDFTQGEFTFILGENGSGKSTLVKLLIGALLPNKGDVVLSENKNLNAKKRAELIGYVPQGINLDGEMSISDTIDFIGSCYDITSQNLAQTKAKLLTNFSLLELKDQRIKFLSGGQKQRVTILLSLLHEPEIVILDEPFVGLDYYSIASILSELKQLNTTILCVTHDIDLAEAHASAILIIKDGNIRSQGTPRSIIQNHSYYLQEIDFKSTPSIEPIKNDAIHISQNYNHYILSYPNKTSCHELVEDFMQLHKLIISKRTTSVDTLKSSMVGLQYVSPVVKSTLDQPKKMGGGNGGGWKW